MTMGELCETLEARLDRPVIDETGLRDAYMLRVESDAETTVAFLEVLRERLGLVAVTAQRQVPVLAVRPRT
jgi:uncharacterized protein (TIGR03435 family)